MTSPQITTRRITAGEYEVTDGTRVVSISRMDDLDARWGQWVARAEWDRHSVTDPLFTLAEAKSEAQFMLREVEVRG